MIDWGVWQYRLSRRLGRLTVRVAAALTLGRMPSFVSASAVVVIDGRVLVVIDPIRQEPVLPGGHLKWDEDPQAAVIREVREETGLTIRPLDLIGVFSGRAWAGEPGIVRVIYSAVPEEGELRSSAEGEAQWAPLNAVLDSETRDVPILRRYLACRSTTSIS